MPGGTAPRARPYFFIMSGPKLLLLDEPSAGLAPVVVQQVFELIGRIRGEGFTVLIVEQNVQQVLRVVDRAYLLEAGSIRASGTSADMAGLVPAIHVLGVVSNASDNCLVQIIPFGIVGQYQPYFPLSRPMLHIVFALDRGLNGLVAFEVDQPLDRVLLGKASDQSIPVFVSSAHEIVRRADIQGAVRCARQNIYAAS